MIPAPLLQALENGSAVLFLGAGIGQHLHRPDDSTMPGASQLALDLAQHFGLDTQGSTDLCASHKNSGQKSCKGRPSLEAFIRERLSAGSLLIKHSKPSRTHSLARDLYDKL